jgi:glycosyltransferase involved in cell wall biosynthesis
MSSEIESYIENYIKDEFNLGQPYLSTGELESLFIRQNYLLLKQESLIRYFSKQKSTKNLSGLHLKWVELQNTLWKFIVGDYEKGLEKKQKETAYRCKQRVINLYSKSIAYSQRSVHNNQIRILIDITNLINTEFLSGIQRVVYELSSRILHHNAYVVFFIEHKLIGYDINNQDFFDVVFKKDDMYLMLDSCLDYFDRVERAMLENRNSGGYNISIVYDTIPIEQPLLCGAAIPYKFREWLIRCVIKSDLVLCNSKHVSIKLESHLQKLKSQESCLPLSDYFPLGSDINPKDNATEKSFPKLLIKNDAPVFLSVGTIEPRKCYSVALDAVNLAWERGSEFTYVIVGRYGWLQKEFRRKLLEHPEFNRRLYWFDDLKDDYLSSLYHNSRALIYTTIDEGYGLPLMEAAYHGLPAIVSDIPVFKEIAGDQATYFKAADPYQLSLKIDSHCLTMKKSPNIDIISWDKSADNLLEKLKLAQRI